MNELPQRERRTQFSLRSLILAVAIIPPLIGGLAFAIREAPDAILFGLTILSLAAILVVLVVVMVVAGVSLFYVIYVIPLTMLTWSLDYLWRRFGSSCSYECQARRADRK